MPKKAGTTKRNQSVDARFAAASSRRGDRPVKSQDIQKPGKPKVRPQRRGVKVTWNF